MSPPAIALSGGALIGTAASALLLVIGRIAGISGIVAGLLPPAPGDVGWRVAFLAGLIGGGGVLLGLAPEAFGGAALPATPLVALAGLLVGAGTRLGNGCTSGHGVCGLARRSPRSLAATVVFMATGMVTVTMVRLLGRAWW